MHHNAPAVMRDQDHGVVSKPNHIDKKRLVTSPVGSGMGRTRQNTAAPERPDPPRRRELRSFEVRLARNSRTPPSRRRSHAPPPRAPTLVIPPPFIAVPRQGAWPSSSSYVISAGFNSRTIKYSPRERVVPRHTFCSSG